MGTATRSRPRRRPERSPPSPAPAWRFPAPDGSRLAASPSASSSTTRTFDLSLRLRLAGGALGIEPAAVVDHDYEFGAREHKWRWLERNRWAFLIRVYPGGLLLLLAPALLLTELALIPAAIAAGWGRQKLAAIGEVIRWLPRLLRERRQVQATRTISASEFASSLTPDLDSPFIPAMARSLPVRSALRAYWRVVCVLLR